jgi:hypothetical protein
VVSAVLWLSFMPQAEVGVRSSGGLHGKFVDASGAGIPAVIGVLKRDTNSWCGGFVRRPTAGSESVHYLPLCILSSPRCQGSSGAMSRKWWWKEVWLRIWACSGWISRAVTRRV